MGDVGNITHQLVGGRRALVSGGSVTFRLHQQPHTWFRCSNLARGRHPVRSPASREPLTQPWRRGPHRLTSASPLTEGDPPCRRREWPRLALTLLYGPAVRLNRT